MPVLTLCSGVKGESGLVHDHSKFLSRPEPAAITSGTRSLPGTTRRNPSGVLPCLPKAAVEFGHAHLVEARGLMTIRQRMAKDTSHPTKKGKSFATSSSPASARGATFAPSAVLEYFCAIGVSSNTRVMSQAAARSTTPRPPGAGGEIWQGRQECKGGKPRKGFRKGGGQLVGEAPVAEPPQLTGHCHHYHVSP